MLVVISFLIFILLFFILFPGYFTMSPALHPSFSGLSRPPPALSSTPTTFDCLFFFIYRERYGFEWAFFTHRRFLPYAPSQHFWHIPDILAQPAFIKVSLGAGSYFLESCRASYWSSKHRPGPSVCLIHSNPQSFIHLKFVFIHVNIANVLLIFDKKVLVFWFSVLDRIRLSSRSATTLISQQTWKHKAAATLISSHKLQNNCFIKKYISGHRCKNDVNLCEFMWIYG